MKFKSFAVLVIFTLFLLGNKVSAQLVKIEIIESAKDELKVSISGFNPSLEKLLPYFDVDAHLNKNNLINNSLVTYSYEDKDLKAVYYEGVENSPGKVAILNKESLKVVYEISHNSGPYVPSLPIYSANTWQIINWKNILIQFESMGNELVELYFNEELLGTKSYNEWINTPYVNIDGKTAQINSSSNGIVTNTSKELVPKLFKMIGESLFATSKLNQENADAFRYYFLFDSIPQTSGAIATENMAVFYFEENLLKKDNPIELKKTITHEMIHLFMREPQWHIENQDLTFLWREEGLAEYLSLKFLLNSGIITKLAFLREMENKIRLSSFYDKSSLDALSMAAYQDPSLYHGFYSKGALIMWLLDVTIQQQTEGEIELEDYVQGGFGVLNKKDRDDLIANTESFLNAYQELQTDMPFNEYLPYWGLLYEAKRIEYFYPTEEIELDLTARKPKVVETGEVKELEKNDVLLKTNGTKKAKRISDTLKQSEGKEVKCVLRRDDKKLKLTIPKSNKKVRIRIESIVDIENPTKEQKMNWERYIN